MKRFDVVWVAVACGAILNSAAIAQPRPAQTPARFDWTALFNPGDSSAIPTDGPSHAAAAQMRLILAAVAEYDASQNALPATLDDLAAAKLVPAPEVFRDPRTGAEAGFVYVKPDGVNRLSALTSPATTPILYELKDGKPDPAGLIGYADGHIAVSPPPAASRPATTPGP
jgi:hypothetical protein